MRQKSDFSLLMEYAGGYRYFTYLSWVLSAISALLALVPFLYIWKIIKEVLDFAPEFSNAHNLIPNGWMAVGFAVLSLLIYMCGLLCSHLSAFRVASNMRKNVIRHTLQLPLGQVEKIGSGKLRKIINDTSAATETYLAHQLVDKSGAIATPVGLLFLLLFFDWRLGVISLIPVGLGFCALMFMTGKDMQKKLKEYQNALDDMSNEAVEYVRGIPVIKTFGQTVFSFKRFKNSIDVYYRWVVAYSLQCRRSWLFYIVGINSVFVFIIFAGIFATKETVTNEIILNLMFYIIITPAISITLTRIVHMQEENMLVNDALRRVNSILNMQPLNSVLSIEMPVDASIDIRGASYSYGGGGNALENINMRIDSGQTVALVGPSGGGKTTLASMVSRFFDPQKGQILIGGVDVRSISKAELMKTVSFVFQDSKLIKTSILENVRLGRPEASRVKVMEALKNAQCLDIIDKFSDGVDTVVGTQGVYLSGGEQQRLAIARAILMDSPIVVLDEATAFADPDNETRIQEAFAVLSAGKTVIMIAHRLSTVMNSDRIFVLKDGQIVEDGSFQELEQKQGVFSRMWDDYQSSVQWKVAKEV
ncbi:ABC transporter ATP-binding protein [Desulfovibrio sp. UCD-KL4C]|uniref:ABC transporter ATP-binding protein n=1 Tax=Desulfovibrio sp. UCD-KL4C TaxID=2578120 RepID=UPI0025BC7D1A|nr:ABC transporter ATP-binding protein [Desulfovibrio sp. UCD-KL4C]